MRTRCGSPSALKSEAIVAASSDVMSSAAIGTQHSAGVSITAICVVRPSLRSSIDIRIDCLQPRCHIHR